MEPKFAGFPSDFPDVTFASVDLDAVTVSPTRCRGASDMRSSQPPRSPPATPPRPPPQDLGDQLNVSTLPTIVLYRAGAEVDRLEGVPQQRPARALALALKTHFPAA